MAIKYPDKPWVNGQTYQYELADGTFIFMVYDEQKNTWTVSRKNTETYVTQQNLELVSTAVDAKFDMIRAAINEATDFNTLKDRLLAVLN